MHIFFPVILALALVVFPRPISAETIGISIPLSGDFSEIGNRFRTGVKLAMEQFGTGHRLFIADDGCDEELAALAAEDLASQSTGFVGGFSCSDAAITVATLLAKSSIPILVADAQSPRLIKDRERENWNLWRLAPGDDYPVMTAADAIVRIWPEAPFAIVDDGTIYGRSFTDRLRLELEERGVKPQYSDSFRAAQSTQAGLLRRLQRSGVNGVFVAAATSEDLFTIAKNKAELDLKIDMITTEAMMVLPYLEDAEAIPAGLKVIGWPPTRNESLETKLKELEIMPDRTLYQGFATIEIATQAIGSDLEETTKNLASGTFDTVLGEIKFRQDGSSVFNPFRLLEWNGSELEESLEREGKQ